MRDDRDDESGDRDLWRELRSSALLVGTLIVTLGMIGWLAAVTTIH